MSRVGYKVITLPEGVSVEVAGQTVTTKGPKGSLTKTFADCVSFKIEGNTVNVERKDDTKESKQLHGTTRALLNAMVEGVSKGFSKKLVISGIGYKAQLMGSTLVLNVGYSHQVKIPAAEGIKIEVPSATEIIISGIDKQLVGQVAADVRAVRKPEPYGGKGIAYDGERIRRKEGKKAGKK